MCWCEGFNCAWSENGSAHSRTLYHKCTLAHVLHMCTLAHVLEHVIALVNRQQPKNMNDWDCLCGRVKSVTASHQQGAVWQL